MLNAAGITTGTLDNPESNYKIHFTNIIPFIRTGEMQGNKEGIISKTVIQECAVQFLKPLIEIVKPKIIITLGLSVFEGLQAIFNIKPSTRSFTSIVEDSPLFIDSTLKIFPMFHCGAMGVNLNRRFEIQKEDWRKVKTALNFNTDNEPGNYISINQEAHEYLKSISEIVLKLQEVYTLEAVYNHLRLSKNGDEYYEKWRSIRGQGRDLGDKLRELANKF